MATKLAEAGDKGEQVMDTFTSDERREIAARLRDDDHGYETEYDFLVQALGMPRKDHGQCDWSKVHECLADLIDPTPEEDEIWANVCERLANLIDDALIEVDHLDGTTVREICTSWLRDLGYDGLCMPGCCGCGLDDLMPCQEPSPECQCAYEGRGLPGSEFEPEDIVYYTNKADARRSLLLAKGVINGRD